VSEPTSALTFADLTLEVAKKLGVAFYGLAGDEVAQVPTDVHDLAECQAHVNNAIRLFISDAPPPGWRWMRRLDTVVLWATTTGTATGTYVSPTGTITATSAKFYPSMVGHEIVFTVSGASYTVVGYTSPTVVTTDANCSGEVAAAFTITANGNYTMPAYFGGQYTGEATFSAGSNEAYHLEWTDDYEIRRFREIPTVDIDTPRLLAVRRMNEVARRWEVMAWPTPGTTVSIQVPYELSFDRMTTGTDLHPAGDRFDEAVKAACFAVLERDAEDSLAGLMQEYREVALPNAYKIDARSAPKRLGPSGRHVRVTPWNFREYRRRPTVAFNH
jgi:hypothetical protein